jgi:copper chaperone NosL
MIRSFVSVLSLFLFFSLSSCSTGPQPIKLNQDACASCKMTISDPDFGAEIVTKKGKAFKFDDILCLKHFMREGQVASTDIREVYFVNFSSPHQLIPSAEAFLLQSVALRSPMGSHIAAFDNEERMDEVSRKVNGTVVHWEELKNQ